MKITGFLTTFQIAQFYAGHPVWVSEKYDGSMYLKVEIDLELCTKVWYADNGMGYETLFIQKKQS